MKEEINVRLTFPIWFKILYPLAKAGVKTAIIFNYINLAKGKEMLSNLIINSAIVKIKRRD